MAPVALVLGAGLLVCLGLTGYAVLAMLPRPAVAIEISPHIEGIQAGGTQSFTARFLDDRGNVVAGTAGWSASAGSVDAQGVYAAATRLGAVTVEARSGDLVATVSLVVGPGPPARIEVSPEQAELKPLQTVDLSVRVVDAWGNPTSDEVTWQVDPPGAGEILSAGRFRAGRAGVATVLARAGGVAGSATVSITCPSSPSEIRGPFTFRVLCGTRGDIFLQHGIEDADADELLRTLDDDVEHVQSVFGRTFTGRLVVHVFETTEDFRTGLATILGSSDPEGADGVFQPPSTIAVDWAKIREYLPLTTMRHEITHLMIDQVAARRSSVIPMWFHEGWARLEQFSASGATWMSNEAAYCTASSAHNSVMPSLSSLDSRQEWAAFAARYGTAGYSVGSQAVRFMRDELRNSGLVRLLEFVAAGTSFSQAYESVAGRPWKTFEAEYPAKVRTAAGVSPGIAWSSDSPVGGQSYVIWGFPPQSTVVVSGPGVRSGVSSRTVNAIGCSVGALDPLPTGTYVLTAVGPNASASATFRR